MIYFKIYFNICFVRDDRENINGIDGREETERGDEG